jgi:uncharacterized protein YbaR (Trm112 family)
MQAPGAGVAFSRFFGRPMTALSLVPDELLAILRCPHTGSALHRAPPAMIAAVNAQIAAGQLRNRAGELLTQAWHGGLLNADQSLVYPVYDHGATMILEEALEPSRVVGQTPRSDNT